MTTSPLPGISFEDFEPVRKVDALRQPLRWRGQTVESILGQPVRLEARLRNGQLFAIRGGLHFLDAEDAQRLQAGKPIDTRWFDY